MIRVDIESIMMAAGSVPSVIVLRERTASAHADAPLRALSIQTGSFEAASVGHGIDTPAPARPITHDLLLATIRSLGAKVERVEINRVDAPVFFATVVLCPNATQQTEQEFEISLDARPSDALALAVRANAPIYVEDDIMNRVGSTSYRSDAGPSDEEFKRFDEFVKTLSPDDF